MRKALLSLIHIPFNLLINIRLLFNVAFDQLIDNRIDRKTAGTMNLKFPSDITAVGDDRMRRKKQTIRYLPVCHSLHDADYDLFFPRA